MARRMLCLFLLTCLFSNFTLLPAYHLGGLYLFRLLFSCD
jgi:hypothetical protein